MPYRCAVCLMLSLMLLAIVPAVHAQDTLTPVWRIMRGSPVANMNAEAWGVDVADDGTIYWATSQDMPGAAEGFDIVTYKLTERGEELWSNPLVVGGVFAQQAYNLVLHDGTIYITGRACRNASINLEQCDVVLVAARADNGDTLWTARWDNGYGYEEGDGLVIEPDGIYVTGWATGATTDWDAGLVKFGLNGAILWDTTWGGAKADHIDGRCVVDDSYIYSGGLFGGDTGAVIFLKGLNGQSMVAKFRKSDGGYVNHVTYGHEGVWPNLENALGMASDGQYLYVVGATTIANADHQLLLRKYDKDLNLVWSTEWGGPQTEAARAIAVGADGNIYVASNTNSIGAGGHDVALLKFSRDGNLLAAQTWGGAQDDYPLDLLVKGNAIFITGRTNSFNANGKNDAFLIKVRASSLGSVDGVREHAGTLRLEGPKPNPCRNEAEISFVLPRAEHVAVGVYSVLGERIATVYEGAAEAGRHTVRWDASSVASGAYVCRLCAGDAVRSIPVVVAR